LSRYPFVPPLLGHPPARLDFIRRDALDPLTGKPQLGAAEKAVVTLVPDCPRPEDGVPRWPRIAPGPKPCPCHCGSAVRVSREASSAFLDARACSASSRPV